MNNKNQQQSENFFAPRLTRQMSSRYAEYDPTPRDASFGPETPGRQGFSNKVRHYSGDKKISFASDDKDPEPLHLITRNQSIWKQYSTVSHGFNKFNKGATSNSKSNPSNDEDEINLMKAVNKNHNALLNSQGNVKVNEN